MNVLIGVELDTASGTLKGYSAYSTLAPHRTNFDYGQWGFGHPCADEFKASTCFAEKDYLRFLEANQHFFFAPEVRPIKYPVASLVAIQGTRLIPKDQIISIRVISRRFDGHIWYGKMLEMNEWKANLFSTKPTAHCHQSLGTYWVSYNPDVDSAVLKPVCNISKPGGERDQVPDVNDVDKLLNEHRVYRLEFPWD